MSARDPAYVRMYNNIIERSQLLLERMTDESRPESPSWIADETRRLATAATTAWARAEALAALDEVSFLTTDPDAKK